MESVADDQRIGPAAARLTELLPGVFAYVQPDGSWWVNNAGAIVSDGSVLVIDTCATAERTTLFLNALNEAVGGAPVRMAVNTHQHGDHAYGNSLLPATTVLFGHTHMREALRVDPLIDGCPPAWQPVPDWGPVQRRLPDVAVEARQTLYVGDRRVELMHPGGPAHTTGDLIVWLPDEAVLYSGDLVFAGLTPLVLMGSVTGALKAIDWLQSFEPQILVPGHGPVLTGPDIARVLDEQRRYYRFVLDVADKGISQGLTPLEAAKEASLGEFAEWLDAERIVLNLHREYADREGRDPDLVTALGDAITWLGGPMHTSV
jgi:cyclase